MGHPRRYMPMAKLSTMDNEEDVAAPDVKK
jgi:hypothetical protein